MTSPLVGASGRYRPETLERLDRIAEALVARSGGVIVRRADALRLATERGVEVLERELGITSDDAAAPAPSKGGKRPARTSVSKKK